MQRRTVLGGLWLPYLCWGWPRCLRHWQVPSSPAHFPTAAKTGRAGSGSGTAARHRNEPMDMSPVTRGEGVGCPQQTHAPGRVSTLRPVAVTCHNHGGNSAPHPSSAHISTRAPMHLALLPRLPTLVQDTALPGSRAFQSGIYPPLPNPQILRLTQLVSARRPDASTMGSKIWWAWQGGRAQNQVTGNRVHGKDE